MHIMEVSLPNYQLTAYAQGRIAAGHNKVEIRTHTIHLDRATNEDLALLYNNGKGTLAEIAPAPKPKKKTKSSDEDTDL